VALWGLGAAPAVEHARVAQRSEEGRRELEQAARSLEASRDITAAIAGAAELERVLDLIAERGRALVQARAILIMLRDGEELVVAASAGRASPARDRRLPIAASSSGRVLRTGAAERVDDAAAHLQIGPEHLGVPGARTALLVPMLHRNAEVGVLAAFDRGERGDPFTAGDERLLGGFATAAANAVVIKRSVETDRLRSAIAGADQERRRWARDLHDQTLQALAALRLMLASASRRGDVGEAEAAIARAVTGLEQEIENLRGIIADLRPAVLDDIGLRPAIESLVARHRDTGAEVEAALDLPQLGPGSSPFASELETAAYRLVQEALTNAAKHAQASRVHVRAGVEHGDLVLEVQDNGRGFDARAATRGFGLAGMRERVYLSGGKLEIHSDARGTLVRARLPCRPADTGAAR
jgi:signal transduction histidine kinase